MSSNINIDNICRLPPPIDIINLYPNIYTAQIDKYRTEISNIIHDRDPRKLIIVGPCSIHDIIAAKEYAIKLKQISTDLPNLYIVMRTYFEKPRTTIGWKGLINDPKLDCSYDIVEGLKLAREFLLYCAEIQLPCACEFLDTISPQWLADLVSFGAIGARTTECQLHRELVSGLSMPVGFKNGTSGDTQIAVDAVSACQSRHVFLGIDDRGFPSIIHTKGNNNSCVILRGGKDGPNYYSNNVKTVQQQLLDADVSSNIIIDCSHGNSQKIFKMQIEIASYAITLEDICGLMIESFITEGSQQICGDLVYGQSITDACISLQDTESLLIKLNLQL